MQKVKPRAPSPNYSASLHNECREKVPRNLKEVLSECYLILSDLKERNKSLEGQLSQKSAIIDKLMQEKQDHILHLSTCEGEHIKKQLDLANERSAEMMGSFQVTLDNYEKVIKKYQMETEKLKSFNKVLRIQNTHLREEITHGRLNWRQRDKKVGTITRIKESSEGEEEVNHFQFTANRFNSLQLNQQNANAHGKAITPEKFKTSKSTNLPSTAAKSNSKQYPNLLSQRRFEAKHLFQNTILKQQIQPGKNIGQGSIFKQAFAPSQEEIVGVWFSKLKNLLADSDEEY